jgi:hypothetical protein
MFFAVYNIAPLSWKQSIYVRRFEVLEIVYFLMLNRKHQQCPSARCSLAANVTGSNTEIFNRSSIPIKNLQVFFFVFSPDKFSFNLGTILVNNFLTFST